MNYPFFAENSILLLIILLWNVVWKGLALWKSARNNQMYWFFALLIINTIGVLEIIYLVFFQKEVAPNKRFSKLFAKPSKK